MARNSVDDAWAELQRGTVKADVTRLLRKSMATNATTRTTKKKATPVLHTSELANLLLQEGVTRPARMPLASIVQAEPFSLPRELNRLADERPSVRKQAAAMLEANLLATTDMPPLPEGTSFRDLAKPLFKRFNDPVEKVRDVCIRLTQRLLPSEPDLLRVLPYLMPAIANRIDSQWGYDEEQQVFTRDQFLHDAFKRGRVFVSNREAKPPRLTPNEPSEEIRLRFLELVATLLEVAFTRQAASLLHAYVFDILLVLVGSLHDDFADVNIRGCSILADQLSNHMVSVLKHFTVGFVRAAKHLLIHRLARVRVAAVNCVRALVACPNFEKCKGSGTEAIVDLLGHRDENVIPISAFYTGEVRVNLFAKLDQDGNASVRSAFYAMIADWMLNLPDRYDHESRLLPYLLSAVCDGVEATSCRAIETLTELGRRYEQEHGQEVIEMKQYGVDGANPSYNYCKSLPTPFEQNGGRPSLGTRLFVRGRTRRFLGPILRELGNWQSPTRAHAVRLLKCVIVYSEEAITGDAHVLLQTLLQVWPAQPDKENARDYQEIADLVGRFVEPKTYLPLLLARIQGEQDLVGSVVSSEPLAASLELLHWVLGGSLDKTLLPHVQEIVEAVTCEHVVAFETPRIRMAQVMLGLQLTSLLQRRGRDAVSAFFLAHGRLTSLERVYDRLFGLAAALTTEKLHAEIADRATATLSILCDVESRDSVAALYDLHFDACFASATSHLASRSAIQWKKQAIDQLLIDQLVAHATPAFLHQSSARAALLTAHFHQMLRNPSEGEMDAAEETGKRIAAPLSARALHHQELLASLQQRLSLSGTLDNDAADSEPWQTLFSMAVDPTAAAHATAA